MNEHGIRIMSHVRLELALAKAMSIGADKTVEAIQRELVRRIHLSNPHIDNGNVAA